MPPVHDTKPKALGRRAAAAVLAGAALPWGVRAQAPAVTPQIAPPVAPPVAAPAAPVPPRPAAPVPAAAAIDRTKAYYVFFEQQIDANSMRGLRRQLAGLVEAGVEQITLVIDSPGGLIDPMVAAYSFIRALPVPVATHAQGFVQSAATLLFLAGQQRTADHTARFVFHPTSAPVAGTLTEQQVLERLNLTSSVQELMASIYQDRTRLSAEQIGRFAREEVILTPEQAQRAGIVDMVADLKLPGGNAARTMFLD